MLVPRKTETLLRKRLESFPATALVGPRQSGKTTLARSLSQVYFDLEQETDRLRLDIRWEALVEDDDLVILDEAQSHPSVFPRLRAAIDSDRHRSGRFLVLGSVSPSLMRTVSESLAGRLAIIELTPLLLMELSSDRLDDLWLRGGYPDGGILDEAAYGVWQRSYLQLLSQRDLPNWGLPARPQMTDRLLRMVAAVHGQQWNASQIGQSLGLTYATVNNYMDYLEGAFLVRRVQPYQANIRKRIVKRPRFYWRDSGLLHVLLGVTSFDHLLVQPWVGASWEGFLIEQILGLMQYEDPMTEAYYFRTSDGYELDLLARFREDLWAFEFKLTSSPDSGDMTRLERTADLVDANKRALISRTREVVEDDRRISCSLPEILKRLS